MLRGLKLPTAAGRRPATSAMAADESRSPRRWRGDGQQLDLKGRRSATFRASPTEAGPAGGTRAAARHGPGRPLVALLICTF